MIAEWPTFISISDQDPGHHIKRVQEIPAEYLIDDYRYITINDGLETLLDRATTNLVEACFVDRCPGHPTHGYLDNLGSACDMYTQKHGNARKVEEGKRWAFTTGAAQSRLRLLAA